jgi:hypothetical protein
VFSSNFAETIIFGDATMDSFNKLADLLNTKAGAMTPRVRERPCAAPGDYEANRELVRRMTAYAAALNLMPRDPQWRFGAARAGRLVAMTPCVPRQNEARTAAPPAKIVSSPFVLEAPEIANVADSDKATARDLQNRYNRRLRRHSPHGRA